jgi:hypothetical protein
MYAQSGKAADKPAAVSLFRLCHRLDHRTATLKQLDYGDHQRDDE